MIEPTKGEPVAVGRTDLAVLCVECGAHIERGAPLFADNLGPFINCPECGGSQDYR